MIRVVRASVLRVVRASGLRVIRASDSLPAIRSLLVMIRSRQVVRASVHYFNTEQEVDFFLHTLGTILQSG